MLLIDESIRQLHILSHIIKTVQRLNLGAVPTKISDEVNSVFFSLATLILLGSRTFCVGNHYLRLPTQTVDVFLLHYSYHNDSTDFL